MMDKLKMISERQRKFAEFLVEGMTGKDAYLKAGYAASPRGAAALGSKLLKNPCVQAYLAELRRPRVEAATMTLQQKREYLRRMVKPDIEPSGTDDDGVRIPEKLKALELDSKLAGHFTAQKNEEPALTQLFANMPDSYGLPTREEIEEAERD